MLAADKLQLQSALKQQATALKEKEFNLHHSNLMTVGTQAAVLAGLDITMFIEFNPPDEMEWGPNVLVARLLRVIYYGVIVGAFCANMLVVSHTTALSVLGAGLALRGPDGSMMTATDGLYEERKSVFYVFGVGLALTLGSVLVSVWLLLRWEAALMAWMVTVWTCLKIYRNYKRVCRKFDYDESETVDFSDIMSGPAAIRGVPMDYNYLKKQDMIRAAKELQKHAATPVTDVPPAPASARTWYGTRRPLEHAASDTQAEIQKHDDDIEMQKSLLADNTDANGGTRSTDIKRRSRSVAGQKLT